MTGLVRKALTIAAGMAVVASVASANVPDPARSSIEDAIVGNDRGNPIGAGGSFGTEAVPGYEVTVRDVNNTGLAGVNVVLDFSAASAVTYRKLQNPQNSGTTVNCTAKTLSKLSGAGGVTIFAPRTSGYDNANSVQVSANGVQLGSAKTRSTDFDGSLGTSLADLSAFRVRFFNPAYNPEADFGGGAGGSPDGVDGLADLSIFRVEFFAADVTNYCP
jgi:hypothetical protein